MLDPKGRVAIVTGASRGIGRAIAARLRASGFRIAAAVRDPKSVEPGEDILVHRYDAERAEDAPAIVAATLARFGRIDALINAAGISSPRVRLDEPDETALDSMWRVNVKGPLRLIRAALPSLREAGEGRVINIASLSGKRVANENFSYAISKFALIALTHALRREGWDAGIRATALCPGFVATDMTAYVSHVPREKMTDPNDLAILAETLILLPNTATIGELLVNWRLEPML
jgi:NAD(P)-dependent dehydrogenase (short-subunit alcohol dehydrogenase family)